MLGVMQFIFSGWMHFLGTMLLLAVLRGQPFVSLTVKR